MFLKQGSRFINLNPIKIKHHTRAPPIPVPIYSATGISSTFEFSFLPFFGFWYLNGRSIEEILQPFFIWIWHFSCSIKKPPHKEQFKMFKTYTLIDSASNF